MVKGYKHLGIRDRLVLYRLLLGGSSIQEIADELGYHRSTIYKELSRNSAEIGYRPDIAGQSYLLRRRHQPGKIEKEKTLLTYIIDRLQEGWSPEQIAGRLKQEKGGTVVSHETIYRYIYGFQGKNLKLYKYLRKKRSYRYPRVRRKRRKANLDKINIREREGIVNERKVFGHFEGDLILFRKTKTNVFTLRERKTRLLIGIKNASRQAKGTAKSLINYMQSKVDIIHSLTLDNDTAFAEYKSLSQQLGAKIYFCDPYKSWQKGGIENGNRLLREKMPRCFNIDKAHQRDIDCIVEKLNNRPMKILGFMTPNEAFLHESKKQVTN